MSTNGWVWWPMPVTPVMLRCINMRIEIQADLNIQQDSTSKITKIRADSVTQVDHLPTKGLEPNPHYCLKFFKKTKLVAKLPELTFLELWNLE
jgi:hypothetical protein